MADRLRRLVLLRHGRSVWNAERRIQGQADIDLDDLGRRQADAAAAALAELKPTRLWSSDLARAVQTAARIGERTGLEVEPDARLREIDIGERTGLTLDEYAAAHPEEFAGFSVGRYDVIPAGEGSDQVALRMREAITEALAGLEPGECGVVVTHGAAGKLGVLDLLGWPPSMHHGLQGLDNCAWAELEDSGPEGSLRLVRWNVTAPEPPDFATAEVVG